MTKSLKKQIEEAQAEMATWTPERRANIVLQGGDGSLAIGQAALVPQSATGAADQDPVNRIVARLKIEKLGQLLTETDRTKQDIVEADGETVSGVRIGWGAWALLRAKIIDVIETKCEDDARAAKLQKTLKAYVEATPQSAVPQDSAVRDAWVSVSDRLPPKNMLVIACWADANWSELMKFYEGRWFISGGEVDRPTHWMPLPSAPK